MTPLFLLTLWYTVTNMSARSQEESEQPAKVYQLDAVDFKVNQINDKLDKLLEQTSGLVTPSQLKAVEDSIKAYVDDEVEKVHLEYGPLKRNVTWLLRTMIGALVGIVLQAVAMYFLVKK